MSSPLVVGVGEVGLDFTVPSWKWPEQRDVFAEAVGMLQDRHVLVIHARR